MLKIVQFSYMHYRHSILESFLPETVTIDPGSIIPLLGRTQYRRGAVVFTLKQTLLSEGFFNLRFVVTTSVNGPVDANIHMHNTLIKSKTFNSYFELIIFDRRLIIPTVSSFNKCREIQRLWSSQLGF